MESARVLHSRSIRQLLFTIALFSCGLGAAAPSSAIPEGRKIEAKSPTSKGGYELSTVASLGGGEADETAQFYDRMGRVDIGVDRAGHVYVLDSGGPRIQVFDANGRFLRSIGKKGEGPGEFQMPGRLAVREDGRLAVFDMGQQRISIFDGQGKLVRDQLSNGVVKEMAFDAKGNLVCVLGSPSGDAIEAFDDAGASVWAVRPEPKPSGGRQIMMENDEETSGARLVAASDGMYYATREEYGVRRLANGQVESMRVRPFERRERVIPEMRAGEEGEEGGAQVVIIRRDGGGGDAGGQTNVSVGGENSWSDGEGHISLDMDDLQKMMPKHRPDVRGLLAWPDGRLWVLTAEDEGASLVADEWTATGEWAKRFTLPRSYGWYRMGANGELYAVSHDADDYPVVHRLRVTAKP